MTIDIAPFISPKTANHQAVPSFAASGWSVDTRTIRPGDVFFALRGPCHDGHEFVEVALQRGALAAVVERPVTSDWRECIVPDSLEALQRIAAAARLKWNGALVGVTGSAGKTSTKDAIAHLLSTVMPTGRTEGNLNNHVGLPLSILRLPDVCRAAVLEMGMNHAGEIRALAAIARPDVGVVTNVGYAHVEFLGSIEAVALAKRELIESLEPSGVAVLNADDPRVAAMAAVHPGQVLTYGLNDGADIRAKVIAVSAEGSRFEVGGVTFDVPLPGRHAILNTLAAIAVARIFGAPLARLAGPVRELKPGRMRGERIEYNGITILNDSYNSNPEAARSMIDVLMAIPAPRHAAVMGEMLELGASARELHREVGKYVANQSVTCLIGVRGAAREMVDAAKQAGLRDAYFFEEAEAAGDFIRGWSRTGDAVLFKGSRGVRIERALEGLMAAVPVEETH